MKGLTTLSARRSTRQRMAALSPTRASTATCCRSEKAGPASDAPRGPGDGAGLSTGTSTFHSYERTENTHYTGILARRGRLSNDNITINNQLN